MTVAPADTVTFLLTPLREGRHAVIGIALDGDIISTHAPAGGATPAGRSRCRPEASYFYSRPCGRGDATAQESTGFWMSISTHAPAGGATLICDGAVRSGKFLLTPLREGRLWAAMAVAATYFISTHAPAGGATIFCEESRRVWKNFYSRPCGRGDVIRSPELGASVISTHAPAGGATPAPPAYCSWIKRFLLTPLREGRPKTALQSPRCAIFLLTPLREGRLKAHHLYQRVFIISTHAPAGGATRLPRRR